MYSCVTSSLLCYSSRLNNGLVDLADNARRDRAMTVRKRHPRTERVNPLGVATLRVAASEARLAESPDYFSGRFFLDHDNSLVR